MVIADYFEIYFSGLLAVNFELVPRSRATREQRANQGLGARRVLSCAWCIGLSVGI
jgi:hypothetical protein